MARKLAVAVGFIAGIFLVACTPEQLALWESLTPEQQSGVLTDAARKNAANSHSSTDCYGEMRKHFPQSAWSGMERIIHRESRGNASAKNPSSSARGCYQMLSMHDWRLPPGGSMYNAHHASIAARSLWDDAGWSPWRLTY